MPPGTRWATRSWLQPPALSELPPGDVDPVSDTVPFVLPQNAKPGTYLVTFKARRDYGGEALIRVAEAEIQVGQREPSAPTTFTTGHCDSCHSGRSGFDHVLHGTADRRLCFGCHAQLQFEPDHALDCRVHDIHTRSHRFREMPMTAPRATWTSRRAPRAAFRVATSSLDGRILTKEVDCPRG